MVDIKVKDTANACYIYSVDLEKLKTSLNQVIELISQPWLSAENRSAVTALGLRIKLKIKTLKYLTDGYLEKNYQDLIAFAKSVIEESERDNYPKTALVAKTVMAYLEKVYAIVFDAQSHASRVRDDEWNSVITSIEQGQSVKAIFDAKIAQASLLDSGATLFGEQVRFIPVKDNLVADLREISNFAGAEIARMAKEKESELIKKSSVEVENRYDRYEYYPVIGNRNRANAVVVCTPIRDEFTLYAHFSAKANPSGIRIVDLSKVGSGELKALLDAIATTGADLAVVGAREYKGEEKELYDALIAFSKKDKQVYIHDFSASREIYNDMINYARLTNAFTALDISFDYLSMPSYDELISMLKAKNMLGEGYEEKVKNCLVFMGFIGLNEVIHAWALNRDWLTVGKQISLDNEKACKEYIGQAPNQIVLIDNGWGDYTLDREVKDAHYEFDYDGVREFSLNNVRKIMEHECSFFAKCGLLVRYALFRLEDESVWVNLPVEQKKERLEEGTKLLYKALCIPFEPVIEVKKELKVKWAGGLCCDGGKLIQYKEGELNDYEWLLGTVCHESYHAFQAVLDTNGFKSWHWRLLGVSEGSLKTLRYNRKVRSHYNIDEIKIDVKDMENAVYMIQQTESEARAFADNCKDQSKLELNKIDWE